MTIVNEPFKVPHIREMSSQQIHDLIENIRARRDRLRAAYQYEIAQRKERELERTSDKYEKKIQSVDKHLDQLDRKIELIERYLIEIQNMRLELELGEFFT